MATTSELMEVKNSLKQEIAEVKAEMHQTKYDILKRILPFLIGIIITIFFKK